MISKILLIIIGFNITTSAFIIKKTPEKESLPVSYKCDFDEAKGCNGQITTQMDGSGVQFNATAETGLVQTYVITDVTSITKPTSNGLPCQIPWYQETNKIYHCSVLFQCATSQPESDTLSDCAKGRFLYGRTNKNGDPYFGELQFPAIELENSGDFEMTFWVLMYCSGSDCANAQDSIRIVVNQDSPDSFETKFTYDSFEIQRAWKKISMVFTANSLSLDVKVQFERLNQVKPIAYFGFDEIEISQIHATTSNNPTLESTSFQAFTTDSEATSFQPKTTKDEETTVLTIVSTNPIETTATTVTILPSTIAPTLESTTDSEITTFQPKTTEETTVLTIVPTHETTTDSEITTLQPKTTEGTIASTNPIETTATTITILPSTLAPTLESTSFETLPSLEPTSASTTLLTTTESVVTTANQETTEQMSTTIPTTVITSKQSSQTTGQIIPGLVYLCDFDNDDSCGGTLFSNNSGLTQTFTASSQSESMGSTTITDYTSITEKTGSVSEGPFDGKSCIIPWYQGSNVNYFCSSKFQCMPNQPDNNATAYCQKGRFLWGRVNALGDVYFGRLTLPTIDLSQSGWYEVVYWVAFSCEGAGCTSSGDSIRVTIKHETDIRIEDLIDINSIGFIKQWRKRSFRFTVTDPKIEINVQFQRLVKQSQIAYFAFDQLEIIRLGDPQTSPVVDTSTSTTSSTTTSIEPTRTTPSTPAEPTSTPKTSATESTLIPTSTSTSSTLLTSSSTGDIPISTLVTSTSGPTLASTPTSRQTTISQTEAITTTNDQDEKPSGSNLLPILIGVFVSVAALLILVGSVYFYKFRYGKSKSSEKNRLILDNSYPVEITNLSFTPNIYEKETDDNSDKNYLDS